jgi:hypothetical protein
MPKTDHLSMQLSGVLSGVRHWVMYSGVRHWVMRFRCMLILQEISYQDVYLK